MLWLVVAALSVVSPIMAGCGNGETPIQAAGKMLAKVRAFEKGADPTGLYDNAIRHDEGDDRYMAFESGAADLVPGDSNRVTDVFVYDRQMKQTARISVSSTGAQANGASFAPHLSRDGHYVAFESLATNLVPEDTNRQRDIFVHDRKTGKTTRASVDNSGNQANNFSQATHLSGDGRYVVFESMASNLVSGDMNGVIDVFVHDRQTKRTTRVSIASSGAQAKPCWPPLADPHIGGTLCADPYADDTDLPGRAA